MHASIVNVDPDSTASHQRPKQAEKEVEELTGVKIEDKEVVVEDGEVKKRHTLQLKMRRLAKRLYPEKGEPVLLV